MSRAGHRASTSRIATRSRVWLDEAPRQSILDLFDRRFTLLRGPGDHGNLDVAETAAATLRIPFESIAVDDPRWEVAHGVTRGGAVLVRPDGHIGWRTPSGSDTDATEVIAALGAIVGRPDPVPSIPTAT